MLTLSIHYLIVTLKLADGIGANIRKIYEIEKKKTTLLLCVLLPGLNYLTPLNYSCFIL